MISNGNICSQFEKRVEFLVNLNIRDCFGKPTGEIFLVRAIDNFQRYAFLLSFDFGGKNSDFFSFSMGRREIGPFD